MVSRAFTNISAAIAILAVDFIVFPTRFSKSHSVGVSLMDVGVGFFVAANAVVSPESQGKVDKDR